MANIIKVLRSVTPGLRPTGRSYGELYTNLADRVVGIIDPNGNPLDLAAGNAAANTLSGRNRLINGRMNVGQWWGYWHTPTSSGGGSGAAATTGPLNIPANVRTYVADRWFWVGSTANVLQVNYPQPPQPNWPSYNVVTTNVGLAHTMAPGDNYQMAQFIEWINVQDLQWGLVGAQPITLSFDVMSTVPGLYAGWIGNGAGNRTYVFTYNIPTANTWTDITVTIPGDTTGTWQPPAPYWNQAGLALHFDLGMGSSFIATATNTWTSPAGTFVGATVAGAVNFASSGVGAQWAISNVQLEIGTVATPFEWKSYQQDVFECQRYFVNTNGAVLTTEWNSWGVNSYAANYYFLPTTMRAAPTFIPSPNQYALPNANIMINNPSTGTTGMGIYGDLRTVQSIVWTNQGANVAVGAAWIIGAFNAEL
jgi:hypothetical protein